MSDLNDLNKPTPTDTEPNVLDTLRAHIIRAATWSGWSATGNKVAGIMSGVTAAVSGGRSLRLYRRNDANTSDEEVVSLPGVSVGGNAATATALATARTVGGVAFNGTADINLPGVNAAGNQSTTGNAATATKLATPRTIGGVAFDGSANINLPGVNTAGDQSTTGNAATATTATTVIDGAITTAKFAAGAKAPLAGTADTAGTATTATKLANDTGSAPSYSCRAWVNFNGVGTVAIRASGNVTSITDNGVGDYTVNFTTAMPDANYSVVCSRRVDTQTNPGVFIAPKTLLSSSVAVISGTTTGAASEGDTVSVSIFR